MSIRSIIEGLTAADVAFVVVGMAAGQLHGSRLLTEDVDIVYKDDASNIERLESYLIGIDAYVKDLWPNEGGFEIGASRRFSARELIEEQSLTLGSREGDIDVLHRIDGVGGYDEVVAASQAIALAGIQPRVITIDALIASKRAAARPKDLLHIPDLECLQELKRRNVRPAKPPELT